MAKFVPREKLGKKARKELDAQRRTLWQYSPVTIKIDSQKRYNRKKKTHVRYDESGMDFFIDKMQRSFFVAHCDCNLLATSCK